MQLKLKINNTKSSILDEWLISLTTINNFAVRKIELDSGVGSIFEVRHHGA